MGARQRIAWERAGAIVRPFPRGVPKRTQSPGAAQNQHRPRDLSRILQNKANSHLGLVETLTYGTRRIRWTEEGLHHGQPGSCH